MQIAHDLRQFAFQFSDDEAKQIAFSRNHTSDFAFFLKLFTSLLTCFQLRWVSAAARRLSLVAVSRSCSWLQCVGFSLQQLLLLQSTDSRVYKLQQLSAQAQLLCGMWDLPGPGIKLLSPALAGGFFTAEPPVRPQRYSSQISDTRRIYSGISAAAKFQDK